MRKNKSTMLVGILILLLANIKSVSFAAENKAKVSNWKNKHSLNNTVLPQTLSRKEFLQYIANELGWVETKKQPNLCNGVYTVPKYIKDHPLVDKYGPIEITANGPEQFALNGVSVLQNHVVVKQPGRIILADKVYIFRNGKTGKITKLAIKGHVRIYQERSLFITDSGIVTLYPRTVSIKNIVYRYYNKGKGISTWLGPYNAWGVATSAKQSPKKVTTLKKATFSTCSPKSPLWQFSTSTLILDQPNNIGKAYNMLFRVKNIPLIYFPYYSFPLNNERKSGLLFPVLGQTPNAGAYVGLPLYLNLAPNYDALLTPQYYGRRGFRLSTNIRYLTSNSNGFVSFSFLPNDTYFERFIKNSIETYSNTSLYDPVIYNPYIDALKTESTFRGIIKTKNISNFSEHNFFRYYFNIVSDPYYLADVTNSTLSANSTATQLLNMLQLQQTAEHWDNSLYVQGYQTLHLITQIQGQGQALDQYRRLPNLDMYGYYPLGDYFSLETYNEYSYFDWFSQIIPNRSQGSRFHLRPGLSMDLENSAFYFKPEIWGDITAYLLNNTPSGIKQNSSRLLPITDIDVGLHLIRNFTIYGQTYGQTLSPRLFYLYVPYKKQDQYPNFDTIELPFFFDQLYALNAFQGFDRIENANQVSLGFSSNIIRESDGATIFNASLGDIYYISQPRVCLIPGCQLVKRNFSPLIASFSLYPTSHWSFNGVIAWDPKFNMTNNAGFGISFNSDGLRIINLGYHYVASSLYSISSFTVVTNDEPQDAQNFSNPSSHLIFNFTWPLGSQIRALGYMDYNLFLHRFDTIYGGLQYDSCCWGIRFIIKRLYNSSTFSQNHALNNNFQMSYFVELTFKGLGNFGTASDALVKHIIPGYKP